MRDKAETRVNKSERSIPEVTVVIPTRNAEATLRECLESVSNESNDNIEVIIVDSESTDRTRQIATELGVTLVSTSLGRSSARRLGAQMARGSYLLFLDSDQTAESGLISECLNLAASGMFDCIQIPECDDVTGIWAGCRELDRRISSVPELAYPRFVRRGTYWRTGGHAEGLEDYMEDRNLCLRLRDIGASMASSQLRITNHIGRPNPLSLGAKGFRASGDAIAYYEMNRRAGENLFSVISPRLRNLLRPGVLRGRDLPAILLFPAYIVTVYGPRAVRAARASIG